MPSPRRLGILALFVLGCAPQSVEVRPPRPDSRPPVSTNSDDEAGLVVVRGQLRAHDGSSLRAATATLSRFGSSKGRTVTLAEDGSFELVATPGAHLLRVAAVDHAELVVPLFVEASAITVSGRLGSYERPAPDGSLKLLSQWVDADGEALAPGPTQAEAIDEERYRLLLDERPEGAVAIRYQIWVSGGRSANGPVADRFVPDGGGDYFSVLDVEAGSREIVLDLSALPPAGLEPALRWTGQTASAARIHEFSSAARQQQREIIMAAKPVNGVITLSDEDEARIDVLAESLWNEVERERDASTRALLRLAHAEVFSADRDPARRWTSPAELAAMLEAIDPADRRLALLTPSQPISYASFDADEATRSRHLAWLRRVAEHNPEPHAVLLAVYTLISGTEDPDEQAELYALAERYELEAFGMGINLANRFDPDRPLMKGKPMPSFDFEALDPGGDPVRSEGLKGQLYLLEFWASWCGPCVKEMEPLHAAYASLAGRPVPNEQGLRRSKAVARPPVQFVFVSFDHDRDAARAFRAEHWSMPWTHGFVPRDQHDEVQRALSFSAFPTSVLVDETGTIVATGRELRGDALLPTLRAALERGTAPRANVDDTHAEFGCVHGHLGAVGKQTPRSGRVSRKAKFSVSVPKPGRPNFAKGEVQAARVRVQRGARRPTGVVVVHLVARLRAPRRDLGTFDAARWLWERIEALFPPRSGSRRSPRPSSRPPARDRPRCGREVRFASCSSPPPSTRASRPRHCS
ncbi:MAG: TlpA family protein disulfide reductase, partial [bacterium]|nr:TlpA family protein disulfide reductase [bacterium]